MDTALVQPMIHVRMKNNKKILEKRRIVMNIIWFTVHISCMSRWICKQSFSTNSLEIAPDIPMVRKLRLHCFKRRICWVCESWTMHHPTISSSMVNLHGRFLNFFYERKLMKIVGKYTVATQTSRFSWRRWLAKFFVCVSLSRVSSAFPWGASRVLPKVSMTSRIPSFEISSVGK